MFFVLRTISRYPEWQEQEKTAPPIGGSEAPRQGWRGIILSLEKYIL
jgi:hypothetical protein